MIQATRTALKGLIWPLTLLLLTTISVQAVGQRLSFWHNSILAEMSEEEITSLIEWQSPCGERGGRILPKFSYETNGKL